MKIHIVFFILFSSTAVSVCFDDYTKNSIKEYVKNMGVKSFHWDNSLDSQAQSASCTYELVAPMKKFIFSGVNKEDPEIMNSFSVIDEAIRSGKLNLVGCSERKDCNPPGVLCLFKPSPSGSSSGSSGPSSGSSGPSSGSSGPSSGSYGPSSGSSGPSSGSSGPSSGSQTLTSAATRLAILSVILL